MAKTDYRSVDEYIQTFPKQVQATLETIRRTIRKAVPDAEEGISYQIPVYKFHGRVLYFAAFKNHYSLFGSVESARKAFKKELAKYEGTGRGTIRFPLDAPVPVGLIGRIASFRAKQNLEREKRKR